VCRVYLYTVDTVNTVYQYKIYTGITVYRYTIYTANFHYCTLSIYLLLIRFYIPIHQEELDDEDWKTMNTGRRRRRWRRRRQEEDKKKQVQMEAL